MEFDFSNRIKNVKASVIREILKMMNDPEIISFGGGNPASEAFPKDELRIISDEIFKNKPNSILDYGMSEGDNLLKEEMLKYLNHGENIYKEYDNILITSGSQQIMEFVAKTLCNEGDTIICEEPSFLGALNAFKSNGAKLIGVELEEDGMNLEKLEEALKTKIKPKFIYVIPNFQNPSGITTSALKRKSIYALAKKYQVPILEDNPYGDLRFNGAPIPSIKSLDDQGLVIYAVSLSKIIAPGMRVAAMIGHKDVVSKCIIAKQTSDVHTNAWAQKVMGEFLHREDISKHLERLQSIYAKKCSLMLTAMNKEFDSRVIWTKPDGGMFIWVTLPKDVDMQLFVKKAIEQKVAVVPGNAFYPDDSKLCNSFRMNFSTPSEQDIIKGVRILGLLSKEFC